jgi:hypothetical protein
MSPVPWTRALRNIEERASKLPPQTADEALFRITGYVRLLNIIGIVTTAIGAVANATKLKHNPSGVGSDVDLCATLDITGDAVGTVYSIVGVLATAMKSTTLWLAVPADMMAAQGLILGPGDIEIDCAGSSGTGAIKWIAEWQPVSGDGNLTVVN